jgi:hypothetical protein
MFTMQESLRSKSLVTLHIIHITLRNTVFSMRQHLSSEKSYFSETHTKRQATQHSWQPSLLGYGDKGIEIVYCEEKKILYCSD